MAEMVKVNKGFIDSIKPSEFEELPDGSFIIIPPKEYTSQSFTNKNGVTCVHYIKKQVETVSVAGINWHKYNLKDAGGNEYFTFDKAQAEAKRQGCIIPTKKEFDLLMKAHWIWDGNGVWFADKKKYLRNPEKSVFFPAAGRRYSGNLLEAGSTGWYWSSSADGATGGWYLYFYQSYVYQFSALRSSAFSVRCVQE